MENKITEKDFDNVTQDDVDKMLEIINRAPTIVADFFCMGRLFPFDDCKKFSKFKIKQEICVLTTMEFFDINELSKLSEAQLIKGVVTFLTLCKTYKHIDEELERFFGESENVWY